MEFKSGDILMHKRYGVIGSYLKCYLPTASKLTVQIKCTDGRIFYAPYDEFIKVN